MRALAPLGGTIFTFNVEGSSVPFTLIKEVKSSVVLAPSVTDNVAVVMVGGHGAMVTTTGSESTLVQLLALVTRSLSVVVLVITLGWFVVLKSDHV